LIAALGNSTSERIFQFAGSTQKLYQWKDSYVTHRLQKRRLMGGGGTLMETPWAGGLATEAQLGQLEASSFARFV
jgi:hypothetical protein